MKKTDWSRYKPRSNRMVHGGDGFINQNPLLESNPLIQKSTFKKKPFLRDAFRKICLKTKLIYLKSI